jgi:hypothetical protein
VIGFPTLSSISTYCPLALRDLLNIKPPTVDEVLRHLHHLTTLGRQEIEHLERLRLLNDGLDEVYDFLRINYSGNEEQIRRAFHEKKSVWIATKSQFVTIQQLFFECTGEISPFAFHLSDAQRTLRTQPEFLRGLGMSHKPTRECVTRWVQEIERNAGGRPLDHAAFAQLKAVLQFLQSISQRGGAPPAGLLAPDTDGVLRPLPELMIEDAPWLSRRIDLRR